MSTPFSVIGEKMKLQEQYRNLIEIKKEIDNRLKELDFQKIKELILFLTKSDVYQRLKMKENQMIMLDFFCNTWLEEKKKLSNFNIDYDIFFQIDSLEKIERKYQTLKFGMFRIENNLSEDYCNQTMQYINEQNISGIAIGRMIVSETKHREDNILKVSRRLVENKQIIRAIVLLQYAQELYPDYLDFILYEAECWMEGRQWKMAYNCLNKIEKPDLSIQELKEELSKVIQYEEDR